MGVEKVAMVILGFPISTQKVTTVQIHRTDRCRPIESEEKFAKGTINIDNQLINYRKRTFSYPKPACQCESKIYGLKNYACYDCLKRHVYFIVKFAESKSLYKSVMVFCSGAPAARRTAKRSPIIL